MRILIAVNTLEKGGRTVRVFQEALGLSSRGYDVSLVTFSQPPDWVRSQLADRIHLGVLQKKNGIDFSLINRVKTLVKSIDPDIIHSHCEASAIYTGLAAKISKTPTICTYHRSELSAFSKSPRNIAVRILSDRYIAISHERQGRMVNQLGIPPSKIDLIHAGVQISEPPSREEIDRAKSRLNMTGPIVFSAGHLGMIKGHDDSIHSFARIVELFPGAKLIIAGDGAPDDYFRLESHIRDLGLEGSVLMLGQVPSVSDWMTACDVFLQPSLEEGFGLVFIEAGAKAKPCVATRVGGIPDIILDQETGFLVSPSDRDQIAEYLKQLLDDPSLRNSLGRNAYHRISQHFSESKHLDRLETAYSTLIHDKQP